MTKRIRVQLIAAGVRNLHEFGYPHCTDENIVTDAVYSQFFDRMLEGTLGRSGSADVVIGELRAEIAKAAEQSGDRS